MADSKHWCCDGLGQDRCYELHVAPLLGKRTGRRRKYSYRCPVPDHADHRESCAVNSGDLGQWLVWDCKAGCSIEDVRIALSKLGIHDDCLGKYGLPAAPAARGRAAAYRNDPAVLADAGRWRAVRALPPSITGTLLTMCIQAISEGDGSLTGDPYKLLPVNQDDFVALAQRAGIERGFAYRVYKRWMRFDG